MSISAIFWASLLFVKVLDAGLDGFVMVFGWPCCIDRL